MHPLQSVHLTIDEVNQRESVFLVIGYEAVNPNVICANPDDDHEFLRFEIKLLVGCAVVGNVVQDEPVLLAMKDVGWAKGCPVRYIGSDSNTITNE